MTRTIRVLVKLEVEVTGEASDEQVEASISGTIEGAMLAAGRTKDYEIRAVEGVTTYFHSDQASEAGADNDARSPY